jgi:hypothetical protein
MMRWSKVSRDIECDGIEKKGASNDSPFVFIIEVNV